MVIMCVTFFINRPYNFEFEPWIYGWYQDVPIATKRLGNTGLLRVFEVPRSTPRSLPVGMKLLKG